MLKILTLLVVATMLAIAAPVMAEEWTVTKLRGGVQLQIDDSWIDLKRGDIVPNEKTVRTLEDGHAELQRGPEIIRLSASTQVTISDKADAVYTIVHQDFGRVEVEAEVRNVQHFAVENRYLAAVVKGTHFIVTASPDSASVSVDRGAVAVQSVATQHRTTIGIGQTVSVEPIGDMRLSGSGMLPAILDADGAEFQAAFAGDAAAGASDGKSGIGALFAKPGSGSGANLAAAAGGTASEPAEVQTAMLASPVTAQAIVNLGSDKGGNAALTDALAPASAAVAVEEPPINSATLLIGLLLGVVIGAIALMLRRSV